MNSSAQLHLLYGPVGSGKTTYAKRLAKQLPAVHFSADEWMYTLHGKNPEPDQFPIYFKRIEELSLSVIKQILLCGSHVVYDYGLWTRAARDQMRDLAIQLSVPYKLYSIYAPDHLRKERVMRRNGTKGQLHITEDTFSILESRVQPLQDDEPHTLIKNLADIHQAS